MGDKEKETFRIELKLLKRTKNNPQKNHKELNVNSGTFPIFEVFDIFG